MTDKVETTDKVGTTEEDVETTVAEGIKVGVVPVFDGANV